MSRLCSGILFLYVAGAALPEAGAPAVGRQDDAYHFASFADGRHDGLFQFHSALSVVIDSGARGNRWPGSSPDASGDRNQYRVTMPKLPPPPPVCAHQRSRFGSDASRVATTLLARPSAATVTTSTAYR